MSGSWKNYTAPRLFEESVIEFLKLFERLTGREINPPIPVYEIATNLLGYQVLTDELSSFGDNTRGVILFEQKKILIDPLCNEQRLRFVLAHEIGHIYLKLMPQISNGYLVEYEENLRISSDAIEIQANKFASALLIPWHLLTSRLVSYSRLDTDLIRPLAEEFRVSPSTMLYRILDLTRNSLLYTLTETNLPEWIPVNTRSLNELRDTIQQQDYVSVAVPALPKNWRITEYSSQKPSPIWKFSSPNRLSNFILNLGTKDRVAIILGGTLHLGIENKRFLDDLKETGKTTVIICNDQDTANYLCLFRQVNHIIVFDGPDNDISLLPPAIQDYVCALAHHDGWMFNQLQKYNQNSSLSISLIDHLRRTQQEVVQYALWKAKHHNSLQDAQEYIKRARDEGKKVVFVAGCFDLLHIGHVTFLQNSKEKNEVLVVGVEDDKRVLRYKGRLLNNVSDRYEMLEALSCIDFVFIISDMPRWRSKDYYERLSRELEPDFPYFTLILRVSNKGIMSHN